MAKIHCDDIKVAGYQKMNACQLTFSNYANELHA